MKNTNENSKKVAAKDSDSNVVEMFPEASEFAGGDLGKIQDILFGEHLRASNHQIAQLQSATEEKINSIVQNFNDQVIELSKKMDLMLEGLQAQMEDQQQLLVAKNEKLTREMRSAKVGLEDRIAKVDQSSLQQQLKLASSIEECKSQLAESIRSSEKDLKIQQAQGFADLQKTKIDKDMLSSLFVSVAKELSQGSSPEKPVKS